VKSIREVAKECFFNSKSKGFHSEPLDLNIDRKLMLAVGELAEAQEELRAGHAATETYFNNPRHGYGCSLDGNPLLGPCDNCPPPKPEGFPVEIADAIIRLFDLTEACGIDIQAAIELKMAYNKTRPFRHGKAF
jgi:hypothetical protein